MFGVYRKSEPGTCERLPLDQQYITNAEFQDVYEHAGRTRAAIRGFIRVPCET